MLTDGPKFFELELYMYMLQAFKPPADPRKICDACGSLNTDPLPVLGYGWIVECSDCGFLTDLEEKSESILAAVA